MEEEQYQVQMPSDVKTRMELINGIGIKELITTGIAGGISLLIAYLYFLIFGGYMIAVGIFAVGTGGTFVMVMKDKHNTSIAGMIMNVINFYSKQKFYKYIVKEEQANAIKLI